jgi:hypothetical protein
LNLLTVLLPTVGDRLSLERAIASVRAQTVPCDLIVEYDPDRTGAGPTLNRALRGVETPWVATFADDDVLDPAFAGMLSAQDQAADLVVFQMRYESGLVLPMVTRPEDLRFGSVGCSYAVKTEVARRIGFLDVPCSNNLAEDWEMIRAVREMGGDIRIVPEVAYYVKHQP